MQNNNQEDESIDVMEIIKEGLLNNKKGIYTIIVNQYECAIKKFGPELFASNLEKKLGLNKKSINLFSLKSARIRIRKSSKKVAKDDLSFNNEILKDTLDNDVDEYGFS